MKVASGALGDMGFSPSWFAAAVQQPCFWASLAFDLIGFVAWMGILRRTKLSVAFPLTAVCYVTIQLSGVWIFNERSSFGQWAGVALIMGGVLLIGAPQDGDYAA